MLQLSDNPGGTPPAPTDPTSNPMPGAPVDPMAPPAGEMPTPPMGEGHEEPTPADPSAPVTPADPNAPTA